MKMAVTNINIPPIGVQMFPANSIRIASLAFAQKKNAQIAYIQLNLMVHNHIIAAMEFCVKITHSALLEDAIKIFASNNVNRIWHFHLEIRLHRSWFRYLQITAVKILNAITLISVSKNWSATPQAHVKNKITFIYHLKLTLIIQVKAIWRQRFLLW